MTRPHLALHSPWRHATIVPSLEGSVIPITKEWTRAPSGRAAFAMILVAASIGACSAAPGSSGPGTSSPTQTAAPAPAFSGGFVPGGWSGTLSFHAVSASDTTDTSHSGDPGSVYATATTTHDVYQGDADDAFTVTGTDDAESAVYGIGSVDLKGPASSHGTSHEQHSSITDKYNSLGCHYTDEIASETAGSWSMDGTGGGSINFQDDGSYTLTMSFSPADPEGDGYETPQLPRRQWETFTILEGAARDCPAPGTGNVNDTYGPVTSFASSYHGSSDIGGSIDPLNPGSVIEGTQSFQVPDYFPPTTLTVSWHLVHDGPIDVTYNEPPPE